MPTARDLWFMFSRSAVIAAACMLGGCGSKFVMPPDKEIASTLKVTNHVGGAHQRVIILDGRWIQAFSSSVQVVDPKSLMVIHDIELGPFGRCGPVSDIAVVGNRLYAVVQDDLVAEMSIEPGREPAVLSTTSSEQLGIRPRTLSVVDGVCFVSGLGGVVDLSSGQGVFTTEDPDQECSRVVRAGEHLVVCVGRRAMKVDDGRYLGAASALYMIGPTTDGSATSAPLAYALQGGDNTLAGLMTDDIREIPGGHSTVVVVGQVRSIRWFNDCVWFVGSERIAGYAIADDGISLELKVAVPILGATDVDALDAATLAIVGTAGRAVYEYDIAHGPDAGKFGAAQREAGRLLAASTDGQRILAGSNEGVWSYLINSRAELVSRPMTGGVVPPREASVANATAAISADGKTLVVTPAFTTEVAADGTPITVSPFDYREPKGATLRTVTAIDGKFWVGHDRGITILKPDGGQPTVVPKNGKQPATIIPADPVADHMRLPGPVIYLFPLAVGKGASYVSESGGMGVVRYIDRNIEPPAPEKQKD